MKYSYQIRNSLVDEDSLALPKNEISRKQRIYKIMIAQENADIAYDLALKRLGLCPKHHIYLNKLGKCDCCE